MFRILLSGTRGEVLAPASINEVDFELNDEAALTPHLPADAPVQRTCLHKVSPFTSYPLTSTPIPEKTTAAMATRLGFSEYSQAITWEELYSPGGDGGKETPASRPGHSPPVTPSFTPHPEWEDKDDRGAQRPFELDEVQLEELREERERMEGERMLSIYNHGSLEEMADLMGSGGQSPPLSANVRDDSLGSPPPVAFEPSPTPSTPAVDPFWHELEQPSLRELRTPSPSFTEETRTPSPPIPNGPASRQSPAWPGHGQSDWDEDTGSEDSRPSAHLAAARPAWRLAESLHAELDAHQSHYDRLEQQLNEAWEAWYQYCGKKLIVRIDTYLTQCKLGMQRLPYHNLIAVTWHPSLPEGLQQALLQCLEFIEKKDELCYRIEQYIADAFGLENYTPAEREAYPGRRIHRIGYEHDDTRPDSQYAPDGDSAISSSSQQWTSTATKMSRSI